MQFIAHRTTDGVEQPLIDHLTEVGELTSLSSSKIKLSNSGKLLGLLHDFGKYSLEFQNYIGSATGKINQDEDEYVDFKGLKGKIDHSTAGAQWIWNKCQDKPAVVQLAGQILSICIASHHSGLINCLDKNGNPTFINRMEKDVIKTHLTEAITSAPSEYIQELDCLVEGEAIYGLVGIIDCIVRTDDSETTKSFNIGMLTRILFSCLIDADRINSADFEFPFGATQRNLTFSWETAISRNEDVLRNFPVDQKAHTINKIRRDVSNKCKERASEETGVYTFTAPTGSGKNLASLRWALYHANHHKMDLIIYIIPYTSIIEQNAQALRNMVEQPNDEFSWILEQHSNLEPEQQTWRNKIIGQNWDAPIVMVTMVQFLEVLFSGGTRNVRKLHQLTNATLIFDEVQTVPINCTHLFCNAINYLTQYCNTSALMCTATQPALDKLKSLKHAPLKLNKNHELIDDVSQLFNELERVVISNKIKPVGWTSDEICDLALSEYTLLGSCLVIVNTKSWANKIYDGLKDKVDSTSMFYLSTNLCAAHRKNKFSIIKQRLLDGLPVMCISTQLIEAGVDVDFGSGIRFLAGLDSIAQAAGRVNRNGISSTGTLHVVNPDKEHIDKLPTIQHGKDVAHRIIDENNYVSLLDPKAIEDYFTGFFHNQTNELEYPISDNKTLIEVLGANKGLQLGSLPNPFLMRQSFMDAGKAFHAIDSPTQAVIVPYNDEAKTIIADLGRTCTEFDIMVYHRLLKSAQKFSVNVFPHMWKQLLDHDAMYEINPLEGIFCLREEHYSSDFGLSVRRCNDLSIQII